ncbi:MAG: transglutaminase-like domain-containing protein [Planctomycetota bacterium]
MWLVVLGMVCADSSVYAEPASEDETWYVVLLGDQRAGHVHQQTTTDNDRITTEMSMRVRVGRGDAVIEVSSDTTFVETVGGQAISAESSLGIGGMGGKPIVTAMRFVADTVHITTTQGDRVEASQRPTPKIDWLPPAAAVRYVQEQLREGQDQITVTTLDPSMGPEPFTMTMTVLGQERVEVFGREVEAIVWDVVTSNLPGIAMREYVDASGQALKSTVSLMPGMEMTVVSADRDLALSELEPPEIMASTLIRPSEGSAEFKNSRSTKEALYALRLPEGANLPITGAQKLEEAAAQVGPGEREVFVRVRSEVRSTIAELTEGVRSQPDLADMPGDPAPASEDELQDMTAAAAMVDYESLPVSQLRTEFEEAFGDPDLAQRAVLAEKLRRFVFDAIDTKDLSVGFANATETAATRRGDCTEHAVLLAALLRSHGIPSRGVAGLVYVDEFLGQEGVFGFHMWTQAWLDPDGSEGPAKPRWIDLDAAIDRERPFDATHIALAIDDLNAASPLNQMVALTPLMGRLEVRVIEAE